MVGGFNTLAGYFIGIGVYTALNEHLSIIWIGLISNILSITISFSSYKVFVFQTKGRWMTEYLKAYVIYGGTALVGIILLWFFIEKINISIWFAQALVIAVTVLISYVGHARFTFRRN